MKSMFSQLALKSDLFLLFLKYYFAHDQNGSVIETNQHK